MKFLAVDSNSILNRAYYGVRPLTTREGLFTNGIFGFMNIFLKIFDETRPDAVIFAFDLRAPTFRHKLFDGYKAQRKGMPEELAQQLEPLKELLTLLGYPIVAVEGYEADDILGTISAECQSNGDECIIATGDRDSFQLVSDKVTVRLAFTRAGQSGAEIIDEAAIKEKYGVAPMQMIEIKSLMGDASDNIPGVAGVGEKTALSLIQQFGSLDGVYEHIDDPVIKKGVREKLLRDKETAYLSRKLAIINRESPLPCPVAELMPREMQRDKLFLLLQRLELRSLIKRFELTETQGQENTVENGQAAVAEPLSFYKNDEKALSDAVGEKELYAVISFDSGYPLKPNAAALRFGERLLLIDDETLLRKALLALNQSEAALFIPDSKSFYRYLYEQGQNPGLVYFDAVLAGYLLSPLSSGYDLPTLCAARNLGDPCIDFDEFEQGDAEKQIKLCRFAAILPQLCAAQKKDLEQNGELSLLFDIEQPLSRVLSSMEVLGFELDSDGVRAFGGDLDRDLSELTERIYYLAGEQFNINSPKQLGVVLFEKLGLPAKKKTKSGYSTDADVLDSLRSKHPIVEDILEYRKLAKLKSTYVEGLLAQVDSDGRVRTVFRQTETRTGRISSTEPNLQNIPVRTERGANMRRFFVAQKGCLLADADYSQIELRVLAAVSNDAAMIEAFKSGVDIHTKTASQVFDMPEEFVTKQMRSAAKAVNFGIVYGIGAFSLAQDIGVSMSEAGKYIKNYLATYKGVDEYMKSSIEFAKQNGYARTMFGRRRPIPELAASNHATKSFGERVAMNTPIQGSAADIIKLAMVRVFDRLEREGMQSRLILQVHDELIVEAPEQEAERTAQILTEEMQNAVSLSVELLADAKTGRSWQEAK